MKAYLVDCMQKQVPASFDGYNKYVQTAIANNKQLSLSAKAGQVALKGLALAGNIAASIGLSLAINAIITGIDNLVNHVQKIKEAANEAKSAIKDIKSEFDTLSSSTNEIKTRFAELAQGVENLGKANLIKAGVPIKT